MTETCFADCIQLVQSGNMSGLKRIYEEYCRLIYSVALQICRNPHAAEDVTSEFFLKLKKAASVYKENCGHKKWLTVSARNLAIDYMRRQSREIPEDFTDEAGAIAAYPDKSYPEESVSGRINAETLLSRLNGNERDVLCLKVYGGFTLEEIAAILKIPNGTAAWRYRTAIGKLKKYYSEEAQ